MTDACIFLIVISKFGYRQKPSAIILLEIDKSPKIGLYNTVLLFCFAVYLRLKSGVEPLLDAKKVAK